MSIPAPEPVELVEPPPPATSSVVEIEGGELQVGSAPSERWRHPGAEADLITVEIPSFTIDRLPYPNDPERPARVGLDRAEAAELCEAEGKRLCHELEWELACQGTSPRRYPSGDSFDLELCSIDQQACASPYGLLSLGVLAREWTASNGNRGLARDHAISRGGHSESPTHEHRCGARRALPQDTQSEFVGFRCCGGAAPEGLRYPREPEREPLRSLPIDVEAIHTQLQNIEALREYAANFVPFTVEEMREILESESEERRSPPVEAWRIPEHPLLIWSPTPGEEVWVLAGRSGNTGMILVLHTTPNGALEHGASFLFEDDPAPIALAHLPVRPDELRWSKCWGCGGEGGTIEYDRRQRRIHIRPR